MKQVILIHGMPDKEEVIGDVWPSPSNAHWLPWIQKQLTRKDIACQALEMPQSYDPVYEHWSDVLDQMSISNETILVGHSCGAGFLVRYFSERPSLAPKKIILVAPWIDTEGFLQEMNSQSLRFFDFTIDPCLHERTQIHCVYSTDDAETLGSVMELQKSFPGMLMHTFADKGHFTEPDLGTKEFPELLDIILE